MSKDKVQEGRCLFDCARHPCCIFIITRYIQNEVFRGGISGKEPICQCRRPKIRGFDPWVGKISWRRTWQPTSCLDKYSCLDNPMDREAWRAMVHGVTKSWMWLSAWLTHSMAWLLLPEQLLPCFFTCLTFLGLLWLFTCAPSILIYSHCLGLQKCVLFIFVLPVGFTHSFIRLSSAHTTHCEDLC